MSEQYVLIIVCYWNCGVCYAVIANWYTIVSTNAANVGDQYKFFEWREDLYLLQLFWELDYYSFL